MVYKPPIDLFYPEGIHDGLVKPAAFRPFKTLVMNRNNSPVRRAVYSDLSIFKTILPEQTHV
jgi:hypothetical protein